MRKHSARPRWAALDCEVFSNYHVSMLTSSSQVSYIRSILWTTQNMTDGAIHPGALKFFGANKRTAKTLTDAGLWTETDTGWQIVDWAEWQKPRGEWEKTRQVYSKNGKDNMCKRWHSDSCRCTEGHEPIKKLRIVGDNE